MSIHDEIKHRCDQGWLLRHFHRLMWKVPNRRQIYISPHIERMLIGPSWESDEERQRWVELRNDLDIFIEQETILVASDPLDADDAFMSRLVPAEQEVWDIRSLAPPPAIRILGHFAEKDVFIALEWRYRKCLGPFGSPEWGQAMRDCLRSWSRLFWYHDPLTGRKYPYEYITGARLNRDPE